MAAWGGHNEDSGPVRVIDTETRHHNEWVFGPGVAVDKYHYTNERPHVTDRFDEYDLKTGECIGDRKLKLRKYEVVSRGEDIYVVA